jgi:signal-transduction protein with cAMP-binding, CBS, and nucleotidyltransferase domain
MQVREVMTSQPQYLNADTSIKEVAQQMHAQSTGFVPIARDERLLGIVTDRDLTMRVLTDGFDPDQEVSSVLSEGVLYCYAEDDIQDALKNMREQGIQRLIVLDDKENKNLMGVVTLSDIADKCSDDSDISDAIVEACKHYH